MRYKFHPEALDEFEAAAVYYAGCRDNLEIQFIERIERAFHQISEAPQRWPIVYDDVRRYLVRVFPYAVLYTVEADYVLIVAVMHCAREPGYWKHRIKPVE